jgi:hypothetical protein
MILLLFLAISPYSFGGDEFCVEVGEGTFLNLSS